MKDASSGRGRRRYLFVELSEEDHRAIKGEAAWAGQTLSELVVDRIARPARERQRGLERARHSEEKG
jgi:hypothetical protein